MIPFGITAHDHPKDGMLQSALTGVVLAVAAAPLHGFHKPVLAEIHLEAGLGVKGDAHHGVTVKHRSRVAVDPTQPNLRQVHLMDAALFDELGLQGFPVTAGEMGENITTRGIDLLALPRDSLLHIGASAVVAVTGLRNPCIQLDAFQPGLTQAVLARGSGGELIRKAGIMGTVRDSGVVRPGDAIRVTLPPRPHLRLERV
jgi:hypothetical protein